MAKYLYVNIVNSVVKTASLHFVILVLLTTKIHVHDVEKEILTQNKNIAF